MWTEKLNFVFLERSFKMFLSSTALTSAVKLSQSPVRYTLPPVIKDNRNMKVAGSPPQREAFLSFRSLRIHDFIKGTQTRPVRDLKSDDVPSMRVRCRLRDRSVLLLAALLHPLQSSLQFLMPCYHFNVSVLPLYLNA
jgi:hypothetical protein